jgi:hypothetical protein
MATKLTALNLNPQTAKTTDKDITTIILVAILGAGITLAFFSFGEAIQNDKIIYAMNAPTANSQLAYGVSTGLELEPFSGKNLQAYKVPYTSNETQDFRLEGLVGILISTGSLYFLASKFGRFI